ncbi:uncharacterized protein Dmoj_GI15519, isoform B [Drosophila mojavensis]|uniref:Uncharacterized protein, isoform B n=1 Tax=Drosophila mojavensis TaxID=7230 RepID=B4L3B8_DROMO|nr:uncharacterized protein Dmoj_GI15519, isoform B [Drosophila mojavensis]
MSLPNSIVISMPEESPRSSEPNWMCTALTVKERRARAGADLEAGFANMGHSSRPHGRPSERKSQVAAKSTAPKKHMGQRT